MKLSFKPINEPKIPRIEFRDVPANTFYVDYQKDLMFKIDTMTSIRIAIDGGKLKGGVFQPGSYTIVTKILPFTEVEW